MTFDGRATLHDKAILAFSEAGLLDLVINLANHIELYEKQAVLLMEIAVEVLREQRPRDVLHSSARQNTAEQARSAASFGGCPRGGEEGG